MEKLNREERGKIASVLIQSISKLCNVPCGASYDDIGYEEATAHAREYTLMSILSDQDLQILRPIKYDYVQ